MPIRPQPAMRGYSGIMSSSDSSSCDLNGNGGKVVLNTAKHTLWQPKPDDGTKTPEPLYHVRVSVLKDAEGMGDCPPRVFAFKSLHHVTHAGNQLEEAFGKIFEIKKGGLDTPDYMGGRVNDGRTECITIEYDSDAAGPGGWKSFKEKLALLEDEWKREEPESSVL